MLEQQIVVIILSIIVKELEKGTLSSKHPMAIICRTMELMESYKNMSGIEKKEHTLKVLRDLVSKGVDILGLDGATCLSMYITSQTIDTIINVSKQRYGINKNRKSKLTSLFC